MMALRRINLRRLLNCSEEIFLRRIILEFNCSEEDISEENKSKEDISEEDNSGIQLF